MRTFLIFKIKDDYQDLYKRNPGNLYQILKYLYFLTKKESEYGIELFNQLVIPIDKILLNRRIFIKYHQERVYSKINNTHVINDLYKDEISILKIKSSYIKLQTNHNTSNFFSIISKESNAFFACDFENQDYFWLSELKMLV